jgi:two-component system sensor histidine kinase KdpD
MNNVKPLILTSIMVMLTAIIAHALLQSASVATISLLFVPSVLLSALLWGPLHALVAVTLAVAAVSFFHYPPMYNFYVEDPEHALDIVVFALVATVVGGVADWARHSTDSARQREARMRHLYEFSRRVATVADFAELPQLVVREIHGLADAPVCLFRPVGDSIEIVAAQGDRQPGPAQQDAAREMWNDWKSLGRAVPPRQKGDWCLRAIGHGAEPSGLIAIEADGFLRGIERVFVDALLAFIANVLVRSDLAARIDAIRVDQRAEALRDAILSSISHDLRTPLAAILGSATTLERYGELCSAQERNELKVTIREEATRLDRLIARMFDLTRIRAGRLQAVIEPVDLVDIVDAALRQNRRALERHRVDVRLPVDLAMPNADAVLLEQAFANIVENAAKYAPPGSTIEIGASPAADAIDRIDLFVRDQGRGLTPDQGRHIFDQFYRAVEGLGEPDGSGLGLAISRAFVEACGGSIEATSAGLGRGTLVRIRLPVTQARNYADEGEAA